MSGVKHEFASEGWINALRVAFETAVADATRAGTLAPNETTSICETYHRVPAHVNASPTVNWCVHITNCAVSFSRTATDDVDLRVIGDYDVLLPIARAQFEGAPPPELMAPAMKAAAEGRFRMTGPKRATPPGLGAIHNRIAAFTR